MTTDASRPDIILASCDPLPEPDLDAPIIARELARRGLAHAVIPWDRIESDTTSMVVLRSTWDYFRRRDEFVGWAESIGENLVNSPEMVRWNSHKRYLLELAAAGVPTVVTRLFEHGSTLPSLRLIAGELGADRLVVKPAVSAGSFETYVIGVDEAGSSVVASAVASRDTLVQPFMESVGRRGERSLIHIDGELTHAVRKSPRFVGDGESVTGPFPADPREVRVATDTLAVLAAKGFEPVYARVDMAQDTTGAPVVMELEIIEPSLFFNLSPETVVRFADALETRLQRLRAAQAL